MMTNLEFRNERDISKTRISGLSHGEEIMTLIVLFVLIQYQGVTDKRRGGQTSVL